MNLIGKESRKEIPPISIIFENMYLKYSKLRNLSSCAIREIEKANVVNANEKMLSLL